MIAQTTVWGRCVCFRRDDVVVILSELEGVSTAQIARLLGVSLVTVRWHLSRGRRELARVITNDGVGKP